MLKVVTHVEHAAFLFLGGLIHSQWIKSPMNFPAKVWMLVWSHECVGNREIGVRSVIWTGKRNTSQDVDPTTRGKKKKNFSSLLWIFFSMSWSILIDLDINTQQIYATKDNVKCGYMCRGCTPLFFLPFFFFFQNFYWSKSWITVLSARTVKLLSSLYSCAVVWIRVQTVELRVNDKSEWFVIPKKVEDHRIQLLQFQGLWKRWLRSASQMPKW